MFELETVCYPTLESNPLDGHRWTRHFVNHHREGICGTHRLANRAIRLIRKSEKSTTKAGDECPRVWTILT